MEPFKIKTVEPIPITTKKERQKILQQAHLNLFLVPAHQVTIDLLTDSGTGSMSASQWGALLKGDESYAGSRDFFLFEKTVQDITNMPYVLPIHQGRAGERILLEIFKRHGAYIISNTLFDTTRANAEDYQFQVLDLPAAEKNSSPSEYLFQGNIQLDLLEDALKQKSAAAVILTVTNNSAGGQPVSLANMRKCRKICKKHSVPLILDACRFAENAWFIKQREKAFAHNSPREIAQMMFDTADICFVSAKKDGLSNIGGFIATRDPKIYEKCKNRILLSEGFPTYGGLAGRDLSAVAIGLKEALDENYLRYRIKQVAYLHQALHQQGIDLIHPPGGHAVYIDAKKALPHIPVSEYPGQAFVCGLYEWAGIRTCEIGSLMMGKISKDGNIKYHSQELVRLAIPRRVYTRSHLDYVTQSIVSFVQQKGKTLKGIKIIKNPPHLRHFTAHFQWIS